MATTPKINPSALADILATAEALRKSLSKADGDPPPPKKDDDAGPPKDGPPSGPPADAAPATPPDSSSAPGGAAPPPVADASAPATPAADPGAPDPSMDPAADQGMTPEQLQAEYCQMPPDELKIHAMAALSALQQMASGDGGAGGPPPAGGPDDGTDPTMALSETGPKTEDEANGGDIDSGTLAKSIDAVGTRLAAMEKSLAQVPVLRASLDDTRSKLAAVTAERDALKKSVDDFAARVVRLVGTPVAKLAKGVSDLPPSNTTPVDKMTRGEIRKSLRDVDLSTLKPTDLRAYNKYLDDDAAPASLVAHLIPRS